MVAVPIFADLTNKTLVQSSKGGAVKPLANAFHQDMLCFSVQPLLIAPLGSQSSTPYEVVDASAFAVTALVTKTDGTTLAGPSTFATVDGTAVAGSIDLNTAAMATAFTSSSTLEVSAYLFLQINDGSTNKTTIQASLTIKRSYITSGTPSELPISSYLTREEQLALFVRWSGNESGKMIELVNGAYKTIIGCNADGSNASDA